MATTKKTNAKGNQRKRDTGIDVSKLPKSEIDRWSKSSITITHRASDDKKKK